MYLNSISAAATSSNKQIQERTTVASKAKGAQVTILLPALAEKYQQVNKLIAKLTAAIVGGDDGGGGGGSGKKEGSWFLTVSTGKTSHEMTTGPMLRKTIGNASRGATTRRG